MRKTSGRLASGAESTMSVVGKEIEGTGRWDSEVVDPLSQSLNLALEKVGPNEVAMDHKAQW